MTKNHTSTLFTVALALFLAAGPILCGCFALTSVAQAKSEHGFDMQSPASGGHGVHSGSEALDHAAHDNGDCDHCGDHAANWADTQQAVKTQPLALSFDWLVAAAPSVTEISEIGAPTPAVLAPDGPPFVARTLFELSVLLLN